MTPSTRPRQAARSPLETNPPPTAVLCFSDVLALGVLRVAPALGFHVPADVSVSASTTARRRGTATRR